MFTKVKTKAEIVAMRTSGQMLAQVLALLKTKVTPGVTTEELSNIAADELQHLGGKPAFLGYFGYPAVLCTSVNEEVVHGIPRKDKVLKDGDIIGLDFGVNYQDMITDGAISVLVGKSGDQKVKDLLQATKTALDTGIAQVRGEVRVGDIGQAIEAVLSAKHLGIVRDLVGHGVGHELHEDPNIPNYGKKGSGPKLMAGMTIAIEPMATLGTESVYVDTDQWTIKTRDGSWSAHFEHTVLITPSGCEVLTELHEAKELSGH